MTRRTHACAVSLVFLPLLGVLLAGCPEEHVSADAGDSGITVPDAGDPLSDLDMDWVCDDTEVLRGTSLTDPDTDGDQYSDFAELAYGWDATLPSDPPREWVILLRENPDATVQYSLEQVVRGSGESYQGALETYLARDLAGATANDFFDGVYAVLGNPPENVREVRPDEGRFVQVIGRTLLVFELRFSYGTTDTPRSCIRGFPMRFTVKRDDGAIVGSRRLMLVIVPVGMDLDAENWCMPSGTCL